MAKTKKNQNQIRFLAKYDERRDLCQKRNGAYVLVTTRRTANWRDVMDGVDPEAVFPVTPKVQDGERWIVYTKVPGMGRGEYAEEIDIETPDLCGPGYVKKIARAAIKAEYDKNLRIAKVVKAKYA